MSQQRARRILEALKVQSVTVSADGQLVGASALRRAGITPADTRRSYVARGLARDAEHVNVIVLQPVSLIPEVVFVG